MVVGSSALTPMLGRGNVYRGRMRIALSLLAGGITNAYAQDGSQAGTLGFWQQAAQIIIQPWVTVALLVVGCLLLFLDLLTPRTWEIRGTLGVLFLGLIFAANLMAGTTGGWIGVLLALAGVALLLLELHVYPGHGIALGGLILLFAGTFWTLGGPQNGVFAFSIATVVTIVSVFAFFAYLPRSAAWREMGKQLREASLHNPTDESRLHLLGHTAQTLTALRPSGQIEVDGIPLHVVTENDFIEAGVTVIVTQIEGNRIVVDRAHSEGVPVSLAARG